MSGGAVAHQKRIVSAFREVGATSIERAIPPETLGIHLGNAFRILRRHGVVREASERLVYLDEESWESLRARRRKIALTILGFGVAIIVALVASE